MKYCMDTSSFLEGAVGRPYQMNIFSTLWDKIDTLAKENRIIAPFQVLKELERKQDEVYHWAKEREYIFQFSERREQRVISKIVTEFPQFPPEYSSDGVWADADVIALAHTKNALVVSQEDKVISNDSTKVKIPNVCEFFDIECIKLMDLIVKEGWKF